MSKTKFITTICNILNSNIFSFLVFLVIFYCQFDSLLFSLNSKMVIIQFCILFFISILLLLRCFLLKIKIIDFSKRSFKFLLLLLLLFAFSFFVNCYKTDNIHRYLIQLANILVAYIYLNNYNVERFLNHFVKIVVIFSLFSLIIFIPYLINPNFYSFLPTITNRTGTNFYFVVFANVLKIETGFTKRNFGIFREPGVFAVFLILALVFLLFKENKNIKKKAPFYLSLIILFLTIFSTFSTTGVVCAIILIFAKLYQNNSNRLFFLFKTLLLGFCFIFSFICIFFPEVFKNVPLIYNIFCKFNFANHSFVSRLFDQFSTITLFFVDPVFGVGFGGLRSGTSYISSSLNIPTNGGINSIFSTFAVHGLLFGIIYCYALYWFFNRNISNKKVLILISFCSFLITIFNEDLTNSLFFFLLAFGGLQNIDLSRRIYLKGVRRKYVEI